LEDRAVIKGKAIPIDISDVDTDQIIPSEFLKIVQKKGLSKYLFYRMRYDEEGRLTGKFPLDEEEYRGAVIIVASSNFGIGSSRENAVWAILDAGIRCVIASSFGDIFYGNASRNGLLCIRMKESEVSELRESAGRKDVFTIDIKKHTIDVSGKQYTFSIEEDVMNKILSNRDEISETIENYGHLIRKYEISAPKFFEPSRY
jgi:3-isopropylmalate/(R)-2-methylmalate dehydratase small subunit